MTIDTLLDLGDDLVLTEAPAIEAITTWTTPLFIAQQADHAFLKDFL